VNRDTQRSMLSEQSGEEGIRPFDPNGRIATFQRRLVALGIDVAFLSYSKSTFYYAGTVQPSIFLVTPKEYHLIVFQGIEFTYRESWIEGGRISTGYGLASVKEILKRWSIDEGTLGIEADIVTAHTYLKLLQVFERFNIVDISKLVLEQRAIKDQREIACMKRACDIVHEGHRRILHVLKEGMTELELSAEIEDAHRRAGHEGQYFIRQSDFFMGRGPLASGENLSKISGKVQSITGVGLSASLPLGASRKHIERGEMIVVDIPTYCEGYHSDQSRTYVVGNASENCKNLYAGLKDIADGIISELKPMVRIKEIYEMAFQFAADINMAQYFMKLGSESRKLNFIGHGVGLELNEPPILSANNDNYVKEGNVIALELLMWKSPAEVVKLEDTVLLTSQGAQILTHTPRNLHKV